MKTPFQGAVRKAPGIVGFSIGIGWPLGERAIP